mgnify:CR=1 FL=1
MAAVTIANGGDNIGVYVPVFATTDAAAAHTSGSRGARFGLGASTVGSASRRAANRPKEPGIGSPHRRSVSPMT